MFRKSQNEMLLLTGDAGGELIVSEISYSIANQALDHVKPVFRRRAHRGQIVKIDLYQHEDVFLTVGQDSNIV